MAKYRDTRFGKQAQQSMPAWTRAKQDPRSSIRKFANVIAVAVQELDDEYQVLAEGRSIVTTKPTDHITEGYLSAIEDFKGTDFSTDILGNSITLASGEYVPQLSGDYFSSGERDENGNVSIPISIVSSESEYFKAKETSFYVESIIPIPSLSDGNWKGDVDNKRYRASFVDADTGYRASLRIGNDISIASPNPETTASISSLSEIIQQTIELQVTPNNGAALLTDPIPDSIFVTKREPSGDRILGEEYRLDMYGNPLSGENAPIRYIPDNKTKDLYQTAFDINEDGIIDEYDVRILETYVGKSVLNTNPIEWDEKYSELDINEDGQINEIEVNAIRSMIGSIDPRRTGDSAFYIDEIGLYDITYSTTVDNKPTTVYDTLFSDGHVEPFKNGKRDVFEHPHYDDDLFIRFEHPFEDNVELCLTKNESAIVYYIYGESGQLIDTYRVNIQLPYVYVTFIGATINKNDLYILAKLDANYKIIRVELDTDRTDENITILNLYAGKAYDKTIYREPIQLQSPSDIFIIDGFIFILDNRSLLRLDAVTDILYQDLPAKTIYTRQKYSNLLLNNTSHCPQTYFFTWNKFDEHGFIRGLPRGFGEENNKYKQRLLDVYQNFPTAGKQGIINGISRELGLERYELNDYLAIDLPDVLVNVENSFYIEWDGTLLPIQTIVAVPKTTVFGDVIYNKYEVIVSNVVFCTIDRDGILFNKHHHILTPNIEHSIVIHGDIYIALMDQIRPFSMTETIQYIQPTAEQVRVEFLSDKEYRENPENGWMNEDYTRTIELNNLISNMNAATKATWSAAVLDETAMDMLNEDKAGSILQPSHFDGDDIHESLIESGVGFGDDLKIVGIHRVKTDRYKDITPANLISRLVSPPNISDVSGELPVSGEQPSGENTWNVSGELSGEINTLENQDEIAPDFLFDIEEWQPLIHSGFFYDGKDEIYAYGIKATELLSTPETILVDGLPFYVYQLSGEAQDHSPVICRQTNAIDGIYDVIENGMFYGNRKPLDIPASGDFILRSDRLLLTNKPSGEHLKDDYNPSQHFTYVERNNSSLLTSFDNAYDAIAYMQKGYSSHVFLHQTSGESLVTTKQSVISISGEPILINYELGSDPSFRVRDIDVSPLTTGFEDSIVCLADIDVSPDSIESYFTRTEVIGDEQSFSDMIIAVYDKNLMPIEGITVSGEVNRIYKTERGNTTNLEYKGQVYNGEFYEDHVKYSSSNIEDILTIQGMAFGTIDQNQRELFAPSMGYIPEPVAVTNKNGVATLRYYSPYNRRRPFQVGISAVISGDGVNIKAQNTIKILPAEPNNMNRTLADNGVSNIKRNMTIVNLSPDTTALVIEGLTLGGYHGCKIYDAREYFHTRKRNAAPPIHDLEHLFLEEERLIMPVTVPSGEIARVPASYPVQSVTKETQYHIADIRNMVSGEAYKYQTVLYPNVSKLPVGYSQYVLVYDELLSENTQLDIGETIR